MNSNTTNSQKSFYFSDNASKKIQLLKEFSDINKDWIINIKNAAATVVSLVGREVVEHVFRKYGASSVDDLNPVFYSEIFNELDFLAHDASD